MTKEDPRQHVRAHHDAQARRVVEIVCADPAALRQLRAARTLGLPDWCLAAGFVRNRVWDALSGTQSSFGADVDLLFFDPRDISKQHEADIEGRLRGIVADVDWEARNQARMHLHNGDPPYRDTAHAMNFWLETCTAVGLRLEEDDSITLIAPFGLDDLLAMVFQPSAAGLRRIAAYRARLAAKPWRARWPKASFID